jgi:hypothetical protein
MISTMTMLNAWYILGSVACICFAFIAGVAFAMKSHPCGDSALGLEADEQRGRAQRAEAVIEEIRRAIN